METQVKDRYEKEISYETSEKIIDTRQQYDTKCIYCMCAKNDGGTAMGSGTRVYSRGTGPLCPPLPGAATAGTAAAAMVNIVSISC